MGMVVKQQVGPCHSRPVVEEVTGQQTPQDQVGRGPELEGEGISAEAAVEKGDNLGDFLAQCV